MVLGARQSLRIRSRTYLFNLWSATETTDFHRQNAAEPMRAITDRLMVRAR